MSATRWRVLAGALLVLCNVIDDAAAAQEPARTLVTGRVIAAGGGDVRMLRVYGRVGAVADSAMADSAGHFAIALAAAPLADSVELWIGAADSALAYHPAQLRLAPAEAGRVQEVVLVPLRWRIRTGRFAGREVDVGLARAFRPPCAGCSGFFRALEAGREPGRSGCRAGPRSASRCGWRSTGSGTASG